MDVELYYSGGDLKISVPDEILGRIIDPKTDSAGKDERTLIEKALENPLGMPKLEDFIKDASEVLFLVNDSARPTQTAKILPILKEKGLLDKARFLIATGAHKAPSDEGMDFIFGPMYEEFKARIRVHDARDEGAHENIGTSSCGDVFEIDRDVLDAERIVAIGSVEPHYFAGYTGGRKSFLPGTASYETIEQNHKHALECEAYTLNLEDNPVHDNMMEMTHLIQSLKPGRIFSIQMVVGSNDRIVDIAAGDINQSFFAMVEMAKDVFTVDVEERYDIVISVAGKPLDINLYQSQKAIENGKTALKDGGILILVSGCKEGIGPSKFYDILSSGGSPDEIMESIKKKYRLGYHKAAKIVEFTTRSKLYVYSGIAPEMIEKAFMRPLEDLQKGIDDAIAAKGPGARVLVVREGTSVVPNPTCE